MELFNLWFGCLLSVASVSLTLIAFALICDVSCVKRRLMRLTAEYVEYADLAHERAEDLYARYTAE